MLTIRITQDTFFKQSIEFSGTLAANQKASVEKNKEFKIKSYFKKDKHYFVKLAEEIAPLGKSGFFFEDHIQIQEIRGVWITNIDSDIYQSENNIEQGLQKLKKLGFNTIYPVVWNRGFTLYKSPITQKIFGSEVAEDFKGRDVLNEIIKAANGDFRVIPWFEYGLMTPPGSPLEIQKPEWLTKTNSGGNIQDSNCWLNPCHPEVQQFMTELIADVAERYDIDGIQLDDHFGMPANMGFDSFTKKLYSDETGKAVPKLNSNAESWNNWRMNKISNLLKKVVAAVKSKKGECIISISPNPLDSSIADFLADWQTWERDGIVEELVLQVYRPSLSIFETEVDKAEVKNARNHVPTVVGILTGLKPDDKRVSLDLIKEQVQATRKRDFAGFSFFFQGSLFDLGFEGDTAETRADAFAQLLSIA